MSTENLKLQLSQHTESFEASFETRVDSAEARLHALWQNPTARSCLRAAYLVFVALLLLALVSGPLAGGSRFAFPFTVAGGALAAAGLLLLFIFPSGE